jgi:hypothetical protein
MTEIQRLALLELATDIRLQLNAAGVKYKRTPIAYAKRDLGNWRLGYLLKWTGGTGSDRFIRRPRLSTLRRIEQAAGLSVGTAERWAADWPDAVAEEAHG